MLRRFRADRHMRKGTSLAIVLLAVGLLLAGIAWAAVTPSNGTFKGKTGQGDPISLTVKNSAIKKLNFHYLVGGCSSTVTVTGKIPVKSGKFSASSSSFDPITGETLTTVITGKFVSKSKVKGSIKPETACGTTNIGYTAKK